MIFISPLKVIGFMGIIEESISTHHISGKISELRNLEEIISILKKRKYNITREAPSEICFVLPHSEYSSRYKNKIREGAILYNHVSGDFEFLYPDRYSLFDFSVLAIFAVICGCFFGWLAFLLLLLFIAGILRFHFLFYKNVIGREFISDLKLKADYP